jgi:hypothetical protein
LEHERIRWHRAFSEQFSKAARRLLAVAKFREDFNQTKADRLILRTEREDEGIGRTSVLEFAAAKRNVT